MDAARRSRLAPAPVPAAVPVRLTERTRAAIREDALDFVSRRYGLETAQRSALGAIPIRWRRGRGASAYYPRRAHGFAGPHILLRVAPGATARWHTYRRAGARYATPPGGIELDARTLAVAVLVHEYTHALQHGAAGGLRRRFSEVETTGNEIEFIRLRAPEAFAQLVPVVRRPRRAAKGRARGAAARGTALAALRAIVLRAAGRLAGLVSAPPPTTRRRTRSPRPTGS
jgi:hypothetical protein